MVRDSPTADVQVPPTISALLSARLDQLAAPERAALACGSVEGSRVPPHRGRSTRGRIPAQLMGLVRKELVRPDKGTLPGDDAFRFRHILIRDAAYEALPKSTRAKLHERFADWVEQRSPELVELDEIVGYHLEQATRYRPELGTLTARELEVAARAAERLLAAGERALLHSDVRASVSLLRRGLALLPPGTRAVEDEWRLVLALMQSGELAQARDQADDLAARAAAAGDRRAELYGRLASSFVVFLMAPEDVSMAVARRARCRRARPVRGDARRAGSRAVLVRARPRGSQCVPVAGAAGRSRAGVSARLARRRQLPAGAVAALDRRRSRARADADRRGPALVRRARRRARGCTDGRLDAIGRRSDGRELRGGASDEPERTPPLGGARPRALACGTGLHTCAIETLAGDYAAAAREGIAGCEALQAIGERGWLSTLAGANRACAPGARPRRGGRALDCRRRRGRQCTTT